MQICPPSHSLCLIQQRHHLPRMRTRQQQHSAAALRPQHALQLCKEGWQEAIDLEGAKPRDWLDANMDV